MTIIEQALINMKELMYTNELTSLIRSSKLIFNIHEAVKHQLVQNGINQNLIYPPLNNSKPELPLAGFLKQKKQDICIIPKFCVQQEVLQNGVLNGLMDEYGHHFTEQTLSINVRSQISSIQKNFDTLFERTYAESLNLHLRCPKMVLGEIYLLSVYDYKENKYISSTLIEKYIRAFHSISHRNSIFTEEYKYETTSLLIVDFTQITPKLYNTTQELIDDKYLDATTNVIYEGLEWHTFFNKILSIYNFRFQLSSLS